MELILPEDYRPTLTVRDTEAAIVYIREISKTSSLLS